MTERAATYKAQRREEVFGVAIIAALIAFALAFGAQRARRAVPLAARAGQVTDLGGRVGRFSLFPASGRLLVTSADLRSRMDLDLSLVVDGVERPLVMRRRDVQLRDKSTLAATFPIEVGDEEASGALELRMDPASDLLAVSLVVTPEVGSSAHTYALRFGMAPQRRSVFLTGTGEIPDVVTMEGRSLIVDDDVHPFAFVSAQGPVAVLASAPDVEQPSAEPRVAILSRTETAAQRVSGATAKPARLDLGIVVGESSPGIWTRLYQLARIPVFRVSGVVTGTRERAHVIALDDEGRPELRAVVDAQGRFVVDAPAGATQWYAALETLQTSAPVRFAPGTQADLRLDVSPGGELHARVVDAETGQPIVTRLLVKGIDGTFDPSFGPDYRASGAGPLMDLLDGEVTTPLPAGRYRVSATHGIEWSVDAEVVEIGSGHTRNVNLALRHVVETPGLIGCDLHVHARPSFDTPVTVEDRVLSLVAAGVDFAVPTEHNIAGDYLPAMDLLHVGKQFSTVSGVEVTTYNPRFGHFGVFPYPTTGGVPPYRGTSIGAVIAAARRGDPNRVVQVNHPRLPMGIGYFQIAGFDPKAGRIPVGMRVDFDTIEVYNGYEMGNRARVDAVMTDWFALLNLGRRTPATGSSDSHRIQYQWAGYPRTYVSVDPRAAGDTGQSIDTSAVVAAIKKGRGFVSSGPIIDFEATHEGKVARPGDELALPHTSALRGKLRVRAAPWVDVSTVEVLAGSPGVAGQPGGAPAVPASTHVIFRAVLPPRTTVVGKEEGSSAEIAARTVRLDTELNAAIPDAARWVIVVVKGERLLDDAIPFMPIQPLGFTNPVWLNR